MDQSPIIPYHRPSILYISPCIHTRYGPDEVQVSAINGLGRVLAEFHITYDIFRPRPRETHPIVRY